MLNPLLLIQLTSAFGNRAMFEVQWYGSSNIFCFFGNHIFFPTLGAWQDCISNFNLLASSRNLFCICSAKKIVIQHRVLIYLIFQSVLDGMVCITTAVKTSIIRKISVS